jgi:uncharacterized membrane protein
MAMAAVVCLGTAAHAQSFTIIDPAPGYNRTRITGLADDGKVVGYSNNNNSGLPGPSFIWTPQSGRQDLVTYPGAVYMTGRLSGDGSSIAGTASTSTPTGSTITPYHRSSAGSFTTIGPLAGYSNGTPRVAGLSRDGSRVVGDTTVGSGLVSAASWIWSPTTGTQAIPTFTGGSQYFVASDISGDGRTAVGYGSRGALGNVQEAWIWREGQGTTILSTPSSNGVASALTSDGSVVAGSALISDGGHIGYGAYLWRNGVGSSLGFYGDFDYADPTGISSDGTVVVGNLGDSPTSIYSRSFVWTQSTGMILVEDYLQSFGIVLPANKIITGSSLISGDGRTFSAQIRDATNGESPYYFVATIPAPPTAGLIALGLLASARRRR